MSVGIRQVLGLVRQHTDQFHVNPFRLHNELLPALRELLLTLDKSTVGSYSSSHFAHAYKNSAPAFPSESIPSSFGPDTDHVQSPIVWSNICDEQWFCVDLFRMYQGSRMALHNHPSMFVVNLMLEGNLRFSQFHCPVNDYVYGADSAVPSTVSHKPFLKIEEEARSVCSWDADMSWMDADSSKEERSENDIILGDIKRSIFAKCVVRNELTSADTHDTTAAVTSDGDRFAAISEIHGNYGNLHELYAETDCSVLSFLIPGYNNSTRVCTWFEPLPLENKKKSSSDGSSVSAELGQSDGNGNGDSNDNNGGCSKSNRLKRSRVQKVDYLDVKVGDWVRLRQLRSPPECCNAGDLLYAYDGEK